VSTPPVYPWFDQVPENLKTRKQLAETGLRPGGPVKAQVLWRRGKRFANLYDVSEAKPKKPATPAQLAALEKAQAKLRTCWQCGVDQGYVLGTRYNPDEECMTCAGRIRDEEVAEVRATARMWLRSHRTVILDTETTDLGGYLVQIAVIDTAGAVLLDTLVNPQVPISPGAQRIHGLSDTDVASAPAFWQISGQLLALLRGRRVVTYNAAFDRAILRNEFQRLGAEQIRRSGRRKRSERYIWEWERGMHWRCAMELYATWWGDWSDYHGNYKWQPLWGDHTALGDARACLRVVERMAGKETT
jgi:DNA polymerase III epsilon subunit-like protein